MQSEFRIFDSARGELIKGITLVEASAGTGKTYAITMLVLRAVVELHVPIDKILIVTFTKAATEELRLRIRNRLVEAKNLLAGKTAEAADPTLLSWVESISDRSKALSLLQLALADIDRAGVFTIHGFCQRMLVEQALESGQLFDVELLTDIEHIRMQIAEDFWRSRIYSLATLPCGLVTKDFPAPEQLLASVSEAKRENCRIEPSVGRLEEILFRLDTAMARLTIWWQASGSELKDLFDKSLDQGHFKKSFTDEFDLWFAELVVFFTGGTSTLPDKIELLNRQQLASELNGRKIKEENKLSYLAAWPLPEGEVDILLAAAGELLLSLRVELAEKLRAEVMSRLERHGNIGFDDLITRLSRALQGDRGVALRRLVGARYAVALIDEFQDTDGVQWHIFSSLFGGGAHALYLIGDPKQAIYKFRGADIHSYFLARKSAGQLLTLEKNYRSHPFLVDEVNRLLSSRPKPFYFPAEILDYRPVLAAKSVNDADLLRLGESLAGMVYCTLAENQENAGGRWTSGKAAELLLSFAVAEIRRLLDPTLPVTLRTDQERPLAPHDIAVLVRSHRQAEAYRQALAEAGIPAVVSSRASVFHTGECRELLLLLQAIASPGDMVKLRTALTIPWFGFTGNTLYDLGRDEEQLNLLHSRFLEYHQRWREQGFLAMMSRLLVAEEVLVTLAGGSLAERAIANINHLLELVQEQESNENLGISQVVQWLLKMTKDDSGTENTELLLESDEEAVRIVTMHGAKGLEYPVVFCPYLWYRSNRLSGEKYQVSGYDDDHRLVVDLGSERFPARRNKAVEEQMAEDLRLLYVAVTRAKICCYVMWADVKPHNPVADSFKSALGYLLFPDGALPYREQQEQLQEVVKHSPVHLVTVSEHDTPTTSSFRVTPQELNPLAASGRSLFTDRQMSSYSAMAMLSEYNQEAEVTARGAGRSVPVTGLPAGASFGNVIHDLLDELSFAAIAQGDQDNNLLFKQKCLRYGVGAEPEGIGKLLRQVVTTPLLPASSTDNFNLAMVDDRWCLKEMGFYYHLGLLATERINEILAGEQTVVPLAHKTMRGYLTGFIDLVCEFSGKYYVLDYKTNFLGDSLADYQTDKLIAAMQSHNYGLQYWIYTLVLHRHLQNYFEDYRYQDHFGGVMYLFVRGMTPDTPGSGVFAALPDYEKVLALDRAVGGHEND
ncbi:MAG: exodeoxyribonuclease V subunit beta [Proteobacteria bacterium]|nr:exodeoxyribonuclease V subunit beta [Pseudomonadota bacterium]